MHGNRLMHSKSIIIIYSIIWRKILKYQVVVSAKHRTIFANPWFSQFIGSGGTLGMKVENPQPVAGLCLSPPWGTALVTLDEAVWNFQVMMWMPRSCRELLDFLFACLDFLLETYEYVSKDFAGFAKGWRRWTRLFACSRHHPEWSPCIQDLFC